MRIDQIKIDNQVYWINTYGLEMQE